MECKKRKKEEKLRLTNDCLRVMSRMFSEILDAPKLINHETTRNKFKIVRTEKEQLPRTADMIEVWKDRFEDDARKGKERQKSCRRIVDSRDVTWLLSDSDVYEVRHGGQNLNCFEVNSARVAGKLHPRHFRTISSIPLLPLCYNRHSLTLPQFVWQRMTAIATQTRSKTRSSISTRWNGPWPFYFPPANSKRKGYFRPSVGRSSDAAATIKQK